MTEEIAEANIRKIKLICYESGDRNTLKLIDNILEREVRVDTEIEIDGKIEKMLKFKKISKLDAFEEISKIRLEQLKEEYSGSKDILDIISGCIYGKVNYETKIKINGKMEKVHKSRRATKAEALVQAENLIASYKSMALLSGAITSMLGTNNWIIAKDV
jgi:hypothetical protein